MDPRTDGPGSRRRRAPIGWRRRCGPPRVARRNRRKARAARRGWVAISGGPHMPIRLGPGPVFVYEWITTSRRWQLYALRALFVGAILIGLTLVWSSRPPHLAARETV